MHDRRHSIERAVLILTKEKEGGTHIPPFKDLIISIMKPMKLHLFSFVSILFLTVAGFFSFRINTSQSSPYVACYYSQGNYVTALYGLVWSVFTTSIGLGHFAKVNAHKLYYYTSVSGYQNLYFTF
jgi:hypothetical protein